MVHCISLISLVTEIGLIPKWKKTLIVYEWIGILSSDLVQLISRRVLQAKR